MKNTKFNKALITILCFAIVAAFSATVFATNVGGIEVTPNTTDTEGVSSVGNKIAGIIKVVGIFVSVIAIMLIGVKYMMGSAEEKAEYKKVLIPYLIGAVLLFGASMFANKIYEWASKLGTSGT